MNGDFTSAIYWFVKLLLYMRIHINKFSCAKYFPSRMMNELNKKYVQFNQIDQWKLFLTAPWSIKNVCIVILICWIMKINRLSCWYNAQVRKIQIDWCIGLAKEFSSNFISRYFQKHVDGTESNGIHYLVIQAKVAKRTGKYT